MKTCVKCGRNKPLVEFSKTAAARDGLRRMCKVCDSNYSKAYNRSHLAQGKAYRQANKARSAIARRERTRVSGKSDLLKWRYGLSMEEYEVLISKGCAICGTRDNLCVDHDHTCCPGKITCGKCIRGALCQQHNKALGGFNDSVEELQRATAYLLTPPHRSARLSV